MEGYLSGSRSQSAARRGRPPSPLRGLRRHQPRLRRHRRRSGGSRRARLARERAGAGVRGPGTDSRVRRRARRARDEALDFQAGARARVSHVRVVRSAARRDSHRHDVGPDRRLVANGARAGAGGNAGGFRHDHGGRRRGVAHVAALHRRREARANARPGLPAVLVRHVDPAVSSQIHQVVKDVAPDGIVCSNDYTAAHVMRVLEHLSLSVPDDVRVAGFDDVEYANMLPVPLTTVRQPCAELGAPAVRVMAERLKNPLMPAR
ncbi:MAG: hypothetical protein GEU82_08060, partial [Luteitalea sp.]|nr:hypothetical protein [Luteitalea sp.]